jgi:hypothetical protein
MQAIDWRSGRITGDAEVSFAHGLGGQAKHKISTGF